MIAEIRRIDQTFIDERITVGEMKSYNPDEPFTVLDCGDERPLNVESEKHRRELSAVEPGIVEPPVRHMGGASGLALVCLNATLLSSDTGGEQVQRWLRGSPNKIADIAAQLSTDARKNLGVLVTNHSDTLSEGSGGRIPNSFSNMQMGCAVMALTGTVLETANHTSTQQYARTIAEIANEELEDVVPSAAESYRTLKSHLSNGNNGSVHVSRSDYLATYRNKRVKTPFAVVDGKHAPTEDAKVIYDFGMYGMHADGTHFFSSVAAASYVIENVFNGLHLDERAVRASSLCLSVGAQQALNVPTSLVIPSPQAQKQ